MLEQFDLTMSKAFKINYTMYNVNGILCVFPLDILCKVMSPTPVIMAFLLY